MTDAADAVFTNARVHTLAEPAPGPEPDAGAVAVRDGRIVRVGSAREVDFLAGVDTRVLDLAGRTLLPGFVDAHTHLTQLGRHLVHADLSAVEDREAALAALREEADRGGEWVLGYGYDESTWPSDRPLTRTDLDRVTTDRPVAAVRVDLHTASLNSRALERLDLPAAGLDHEDGEPTGVVVEAAAEAVRDAVAPDYARTRDLLLSAREYAHERGVTGVGDLVRDSLAPRVYRDLAAAGELQLRVRVHYWHDHLDAAVETGLRTDRGRGVGGDGDLVRVGAVKTFSDGSLGARTARLSEPYADDPDDATGASESETRGDEDAAASGDRGEWVRPPADVRATVERAHRAGFQVCVHAIGDEAIEVALSAFEPLDDGADGDGPGASDPDRADGVPWPDDPDSGVRREPRHRIEHAELATDEQFDRMAAAGVVASMQPNFLRWARPGGLYDRRLGERRRRRADRFREALDRGVDLAFGSDCMPLGPLAGICHAVTAPEESQRLSVGEALRAYTHGAARAGFDEDRVGTIEAGKRADLVALERSPWADPERIDEIGVSLTVVDGDVVHDAR